MIHPANKLAVWKLRRLLRRAEGLSWSDVEPLNKAQLVELRIGAGSVASPYHHIHYVPTAVIHRKSKGF